MAEWEKKIGAINLIVADLEASKSFYEDVFGLPLGHADEETAMFRFGETYVFLHRGTERHDGRSGDRLRLAQQGVGQFVIFTDDADAVRAELDRHGVSIISGPEDREWGMRTLTFADPAGTTWEITQPLPGSS